MQQQTAPRPRAGPAGPSKLHLLSSIRWGLQGVGELQINRQPPAMGGQTRRPRLLRRVPGALGRRPAPKRPGCPSRTEFPRSARPAPGPPGRAVLGAAARHVLRRCRPPSADASTSRSTRIRSSDYRGGLVLGVRAGVLTPPSPESAGGTGQPWGRGGGEWREQEQPRAPECPIPNSKVARGGSLRSPQGLKQRDPFVPHCRGLFWLQS